jgi:hypothetical protein
MRHRSIWIPRRVLWRTAAALAVLAAFHGASRSAPSSGFDLVLRSIEDQDPIVTIEGDVDLTGIDVQLRQQLPGEIRQAAPDLFLDRDVAVLRYRNIRATVTGVQFATTGVPREVAVQATVLISADRERARLSLAGRQWNPDGNADVAVVDLAGRIAVAPSGGAVLNASALLDQIRIQVLLQLFNGMTLKVPLGGRQIASRSFDVAPSQYVPAGTTITSISVLAVQGKTARVRVVLTLPLADAGTPNSSASDAGVPDTGTVSP